jgi:two-component system phosphate regulon sensor histidine kinase PhoR
LYSIAYNLCDNAIKYNHRGGSVSVFVSQGERETVLKVKDSGIGIPEDEQERIFERFYRVDKSRSKEAEGTGLGLSIVKHAVKIHNGTIKLSSSTGEGSEFIVTIPNKPVRRK